jgi:N-acetylglucosamine-6-phosphate deacetylase
MKFLKINIVSNNKIFEGEIRFDNKIRSIRKISDNENPNLEYLLPGFIDLHIHGGGGVDVMDNSDISTILKTHCKNGTTSLLLTTVTATKSDLESVFRKIENKKSHLETGEAKILGVHLEGPFINKEKLGAQPDFSRNLDLEEVLNLHKLSNIKIITLAPELSSNEILAEIIKQKIIVQVGHTNGSYEDGLNALANGAKSFTHLYNAMSGFHHRNPGIVGAALAHAEYSEIIPDLLHVHPGAIKAALRAIPKLYFVTDATSAVGMNDGEFKLGTHTVSKCGNGVRLKDGTLAGSALSMFAAFKNLVSNEIGLSIAEASYRLSTIQSELLGIALERGSIKEELYSDLIIIDRNLEIKKVYVEGEEA